MLIPIFTNNKGITPKKLSKSKLATTHIVLVFSILLLGIPAQSFINKDSYSIIFFFAVIANVIGFISFMMNLLTLYRHWKWIENNNDKNC